MEKFTSITSITAPLDRANVDTDAIIPKQYLKSIHIHSITKAKQHFHHQINE